MKELRTVMQQRELQYQQLIENKLRIQMTNTLPPAGVSLTTTQDQQPTQENL